ncbi:unnamed protein product [Cuscuta europaea]|uniref:Retrovirus-related Pol polyprotein from transposon TNT 1-94 n=1 Tax=Cuscuta europaea TaxID=41803 RepID=A0A9P0YMM1_CUSEU|nr:unnamed protein product [Cuscuta europaea]
MLFVWMLSSLSETLHARIIHCQRSYELWNTIHNFFQANIVARARQLKSELYNTGKGERSISEYLLRIQTLVNNLILVGEPISNKDHSNVILEGLPQDYEALVSSVTSRSILEPVTLAELESLLLAKEMRLKKHHDTTQQSIFSANVAQVDTSSQNNSSEISISVENASANVSQYNNPNSDNPYRGRGRSGYHRGRGGRSGRNSIICQVCGKSGHHALICYHRYNPAYTNPNPNPSSQNPNYPNQTSGPPPYSNPNSQSHYPQNHYTHQPKPYTFQSQSIQSKPNQSWNHQPTNPSPPPETFNWGHQQPFNTPPIANYATANHSVLGPIPSNQHWFPDSGATHHVTADPLNFQHSEPIATSDKLFMGNGQGF